MRLTEKDNNSKDLKLCDCGCGTLIPIRDIRGRSRRFVDGHFNRGERCNFWKGGKIINSDGYVEIYSPDHHKATKSRPYVKEHVDVMEKHIGRYLRKGEEVHHINEDKLDNRIQNLQLMSRSEHLSYNKKGHMYGLGKHKDTCDRVCFNCKS
ncbi:MAG: HNH endonuclease [Candidatus Nitrosocosmicus sp.]|nr:HNH endonuclease [Candidatus Nitrosocosmicus sp.]